MATGNVDAMRDGAETFEVEGSDPKSVRTEIDTIVLNEIRKARMNGNRADSESVAASIRKKHSLA